MLQSGYAAVLARRLEILEASTGLEYRRFEMSPVSFDYEGLLAEADLELPDIQRVQQTQGVGLTPLLELKNLTRLVRRMSPPGRGARLFIKDEACNPSGSCKDRSAAISALYARTKGFRGLAAMSNGSYGVALASQQAINQLKAIIIQEAYDGTGQVHPRVLEKARKCEALGAEVIQASVGPERFLLFLDILRETGFLNASLTAPWAIVGLETLGLEIAQQVREQTGRDPDAVVVTHAVGGQATGTARGLRKAGAYRTRIIGACVNLMGLDTGSNANFSRKLFSTGHSGLAIPRTMWPDGFGVVYNAARPLRYLDQLVMVAEGEVLYMTEALAQLEGLERAPAGNTALTAAISLAREMDRDQVVVISETEYASTTDNPMALLAFAREMGLRVEVGNPNQSRPGHTVVIPAQPEQLGIKVVDLDFMRRGHIHRVMTAAGMYAPDHQDLQFLAAETNTTPQWVRGILADLKDGLTAVPTEQTVL